MIRFEGVSFGYSGSLFADLSLEARSGSVTSLCGPNGSGKSTVLRLAAGLLAPRAGRVLLGGDPLCGLASAERARRVSYLPQSPLFPVAWTVEELAALGDFPYECGRGEPRPLECRLTEARAALTLEDIWDRPLGTLSGGERQRAALARVLVQDAPALILDEPASHLDPRNQVALFRLLGQLAAGGKTVFQATHDLNLALAFGHRIAVLDRGGTLRDLAGSPEERSELLGAIFETDFQPVLHRGTWYYLPSVVPGANDRGVPFPGNVGGGAP